MPANHPPIWPLPEHLEPELRFTTSRSGGSGGQHVNKVETAVSASWHPASSLLLTEEEKQRLAEKLSHRMDRDGFLTVRSQVHRGQRANRDEAVERLAALVRQALLVRKPRIATKPTKASRERRMEQKKRNSMRKQARGKWTGNAE